MKRADSVKTQYGFDSGKYNPNTFNSLDASVCFLLVIVLSFIVQMVFRFAFNAYKQTHESFDYYLLSIISVFLAQAVIFLVAFFAGKIRRVGFLTGGGFRFSFDKIEVLFSVMLALGIALVFSGAHQQFVDDVWRITYGADYDAFLQNLNEQVDGNLLLALFYSLIVAPIVPAIVEEGLFRGVVLRGARQIGPLFAIFISGLCFSLMHGNLEQLILQFIFGVSVGAVVLLTKNFLLGSVMHFTNNLMVYLLAVVSNIAGLYSDSAYYFVDAFSIIIGVALLVVSVTYFINKLLAQQKKKLLNIPRKRSESDEKKYALICFDGGEDVFGVEPIYSKVFIDEVNASSFEWSGKTYHYKGEINVMNGKGNVLASKIIFAIGIALSVVFIFI